jgi:hypothetical protein
MKHCIPKNKYEGTQRLEELFMPFGPLTVTEQFPISYMDIGDYHDDLDVSKKAECEKFDMSDDEEEEEEEVQQDVCSEKMIDNLLNSLEVKKKSTSKKTKKTRKQQKNKSKKK